MPRSHRCIFVALVGWLSLAAQPKDAARQPTDGTNHEIATALNNLATTIQQPQKPSKHDEPCDAGDNKRSSDLCAQWKAADAANSAANAAWWIGALGTLIGAATLAAAWAAALYAKEAARHTETGAKEAKRAADAAETGLRHTEKVTRAQLRAYLAGEAETFKMTEDKRVILGFRIRNVGQTPAHGLKTSRSARFVVNGKRRKIITTYSEDSKTWGTVGPKVPLETFEYARLTPGKVRALRANIAYMEAELSVRFTDVFGERWTYRHAVRADGESIETGLLYTMSCETNADKEERQKELPLQPKKRRTGATKAKAERA